MVNRDDKSGVAPGGRVHRVLSATIGIQASAVEQLAWRHIFDEEHMRRLKSALKSPGGYEPNHRNKKYTEYTIHLSLGMKKWANVGS